MKFGIHLVLYSFFFELALIASPISYESDVAPELKKRVIGPHVPVEPIHPNSLIDKLNDRNVQGFDLKRGPAMSSGVETLRYVMEITMNHPKFAQKMGFIGPPLHTKAWKKRVNIPRLKNLDLPGILHQKEPGSIKGVWIEWSKKLSNPLKGDFKISPNQPVILQAHGGGFVFGSTKTHQGFSWRLSKDAKAKVLSIDYRLSPQNLFPAALHDYLSSYFYLIDTLKVNPKQIVFSGDSAGGNLALSAALWLRDNGFDMPGGLALISPWLDLSRSLPSIQINQRFDYLPKLPTNPKHKNPYTHYIQDTDLTKNHLVSPIRAEDNGRPLPPTFITVGDAELLRDENILFAKKFRNVHLEIIEDAPHVTQLFSGIDEFSRSTLRLIGNFIAETVEAGEQRSHPSTSQVYWLRKSGERHLIDSPLDVIEHGRNQLKKDGKWTEDQDKKYKELLVTENK